MNMTTEEKINMFIAFLKNELYEQRISVADFAKKMNVQRNGVYKWLKKENIMGLDKYFKALEVLGVTEQDILDFNSQQNGNTNSK